MKVYHIYVVALALIIAFNGALEVLFGADQFGLRIALSGLMGWSLGDVIADYLKESENEN